MEKNSFIYNFKRLPTGLAWMLVLFFLLEAAVRIFWHPGFVGNKLYMMNPAYDYGYDTRTPLFYSEKNKYTCYPSQYITIYKQSLPKHKAKNEIRIFVFGASVGKGSKGSNYPYFLEQALNNSYPDKSWRVINFSVVGIGTSRMLVLLKKSIEYKADFFIYHIHGSNEYEDERDEACRDAMAAGINGILYSSNLLVLAKKTWDIKNPPVKTVSLNVDDERTANTKIENIQRWNTRAKKNLSAMVNIAREKKIPVILMARAIKDFEGDPHEAGRTLKMNSMIKSFVDSQYIFYFPTDEVIHGSFVSGKDIRGIFRDKIHYTPQGHRFVADNLLAFIDRIFIFRKPL